MDTRRPRIVIIGAGFGGIFAARALRGQAVDVLVIDRQNFHTFTPLLYQVATSGLQPADIAFPVRGIFRGIDNIRFLLGEVTEIDTRARQVSVRADHSNRVEAYDYLIVAGGSVTNYFGNTSLEMVGLPLKDLQDAVALRHHILRLFERAAWETDESQREALMTIVVVGGGPTGLETAGAIQELYQWVLRKDYAGQQPSPAQVILVEAADRLLTPYPKDLQTAALEQLRSLGVEVLLNSPVTEITQDHIVLKDGTRIDTHTLIWSAGVKASPLAHMLGVALERGGRVPIAETMQASGLDDVYVVGDMAHLPDAQGQPYPMLIPFAQQGGTLAARNILRRISSQPQATFRYTDRGIMATIGRNRAVAWIFNRIPLRGWFAWIAWLGLHLLTLMGFRNRLSVILNWMWNYWTFDRSVRIILPQREDDPVAVSDSQHAVINAS
jgi:NADH dehydrogenase